MASHMFASLQEEIEFVGFGLAPGVAMGPGSLARELVLSPFDANLQNESAQRA